MQLETKRTRQAANLDAFFACPKLAFQLRLSHRRFHLQFTEPLMRSCFFLSQQLKKQAPESESTTKAQHPSKATNCPELKDLEVAIELCFLFDDRFPFLRTSLREILAVCL